MKFTYSGHGQDYVFVIDCSGSMVSEVQFEYLFNKSFRAESRLKHLSVQCYCFCKAYRTDVLLILLRYAPARIPRLLTVIIQFGSSFKTLFTDNSKPLNNENLRIAREYVSKVDADMGGTDLTPALRDIASVSFVYNAQV